MCIVFFEARGCFSGINIPIGSSKTTLDRPAQSGQIAVNNMQTAAIDRSAVSDKKVRVSGFWKLGLLNGDFFTAPFYVSSIKAITSITRVLRNWGQTVPHLVQASGLRQF